jgi:hypothetical protein
MRNLVVLKNQWQAQPPPQLAGGVLVAVSELAAEVVSLAVAPPATDAGADVPPEPPLKSVAYQPEPLS